MCLLQLHCDVAHDAFAGLLQGEKVCIADVVQGCSRDWNIMVHDWNALQVMHITIVWLLFLD